MAGALQLFTDHSCIALAHPARRCVFACSAGSSSNGFGQRPKEKPSVGGAQLRTEKIFYFWVVGQSHLENFYSNNLELASQPTPALVCLALYLFYINKYIEIGTIHDSETFTRMVLHAFTVSHGVLKSHYLQRNPLFYLSCHLFS